MPSGQTCTLIHPHYRRLIAYSGQKFEVNHPLPLNVSHRPRRRLVISPCPSNFMGVRAF